MNATLGFCRTGKSCGNVMKEKKEATRGRNKREIIQIGQRRYISGIAETWSISRSY